MDIKKLLGRRIREIRKARNLTQEELADYVGIETSSISNIENGKYFPNAENLDKILTYLEVIPSEVFAFESFAPKEDLIDEMMSAMQGNDKLTRLLYKFFLTVKSTN